MAAADSGGPRDAPLPHLHPQFPVRWMCDSDRHLFDNLPKQTRHVEGSCLINLLPKFIPAMTMPETHFIP